MPASLLIPKPGGQEAEWEAYARQRNCYCSLWADKPEIYSERGLPPGFCGKCERCGAMGHARHFPGPVPYTGAWCDRCYRIVGLMWILRHPIGWIYLAALGGIAYFIVRVIYQVLERLTA